MNTLTNHAQKRCQQRGIPPLIVDWLLDYGTPVYNHGAEVFYFDKRSRKAIRRQAGKQVLSALERYMDAYLVFRAGQVLTVGHRYKSVRSN